MHPSWLRWVLVEVAALLLPRPALPGRRLTRLMGSFGSGRVPNRRPGGGSRSAADHLLPGPDPRLGAEIGTVETGKIANLIVTEGDPLQIRTRVRSLIIQGEQVSLDNKP
jgi:hypothetical protein